MLLDELNHRVAQVAEGVGNIGFLVGATVVKPVGLVVRGSAKRSGPEQIAPLLDGRVQVVDQIGLLKKRSVVHRISHRSLPGQSIV